MLIHFLPIFDCQFLYEGWRRSYAAAAAGNYWRRAAAAASRICHGAPARQPDSTAASRIGDGGADEGSITLEASTSCLNNAMETQNRIKS